MHGDAVFSLVAVLVTDVMMRVRHGPTRRPRPSRLHDLNGERAPPGADRDEHRRGFVARKT